MCDFFPQFSRRKWFRQHRKACMMEFIGLSNGVIITVNWGCLSCVYSEPLSEKGHATTRVKAKAKSCISTCKISKHMWCILKNTCFCSIYSALEFNSSLEMDQFSSWVTAFCSPTWSMPICANLQQKHRSEYSHFIFMGRLNNRIGVHLLKANSFFESKENSA